MKLPSYILLAIASLHAAAPIAHAGPYECFHAFYVKIDYPGGTAGYMAKSWLNYTCNIATGTCSVTSSGFTSLPVGAPHSVLDAYSVMGWEPTAHRWVTVTGNTNNQDITPAFQFTPEATQVSALTDAAVAAAKPGGCPVPNPCEGKEGQSGAPIYTGLPYDAHTYEQTGICDNGCVAKPAAGPILSSYADDGSGYIIGPWTYTGDPCETGVTSPLPAQPTPEDQTDQGENACQAKCQGRAYQFDAATGECECFGAPGVIEPPLEPTVPTTDPGSPAVPSAQTPATDPGGDPQLSAQISNQGKQIGQGDAQLGQLGAINNKLGAVISNQGKQIGQGDKSLDYQRRQLDALEDIKNELAKDDNESQNPGLPDNLQLDTGVGDAKNWTEHDDSNQVARNRATEDINGIPSTPQLPMSIDLQISSSPVLSGQMFGKTIEIRFDRPWMETGYSIMAVMLIGIGYLQVFLMVNRTLTNNG